MNEPIAVDIGYSSTKVSYRGKQVRFPTAISFATDIGTQFGQENVYKFEGEKYYVGQEAVSEESFTTTDYKFLRKFAPLLIFHILKKFDEHNLDMPIVVKTGLAISDWDKRDDFKQRLSTIEVDGKKIDLQVTVIPQGAGAIIDWVNNENNGVYPDRISVIDIGHNTINFLSYVNGRPVKKDISGYPGHGISSIIKPFTNYLENTYKMNFSQQEAIQIFIKNKFMFNGEDQENVREMITQLKKQFVSKLFNSVLVNDKKIIGISDIVLLAGGGALLLQDVDFPPQYKIIQEPVFANVRGYAV